MGRELLLGYIGSRNLANDVGVLRRDSKGMRRTPESAYNDINKLRRSLNQVPLEPKIVLVDETPRPANRFLR